jgi:6-phosphogluconolactonase
VAIPAAQVHRIKGELADARDAARDYQGALREGFAAAGRTQCTFDLVILGLGEDAHIASIFPGSPVVAQTDPSPPVVAVWAAHLRSWRITLTPPALLDARAIVMVVAGAAKAPAMKAALELPDDIERWPAQRLREAGSRVEWMVDGAAASRLDRRDA